jgi:hypothetical protein
MKSGKRITLLVALFALAWLMVMGFVYRSHLAGKTGHNLTVMSADVTAMGETRKFYNIFQDKRKTGYLIASRLTVKNLKILREEVVLKVNLSGMSRELFIQSTAGVDSASMRMEYFEFRIQSGVHTFVFNSSLHEDSLLINVRKNEQSPWRRGAFITKGSILPTVSLPFRMRYTESRHVSAQVFDPVVFALRDVEIVRGNSESLRIGAKDYGVTRYDLRLGEAHATAWLDSLGWMVRQEGVQLFGPALGDFTIEIAEDRNVFLLPVETSLGRDTIRSWEIPVPESIPNPRSVEYLEIELDGIRAATIDTESSNKETRSLNPLVLGVHNCPVAKESRLAGILNAVSVDTSLVGVSDYIQSKDARMARTALEIVGAERDTLTMARSINRWVHEKVRKDSSMFATRSVDVFRALRGGRDEHTKLFAALTRSVGIPVQINAGLAYERGVFRYHSWPSVFAGGAWHDLDPWYGQDIADAARVALVRGDFERLEELLRLIGVLSLKVITYR